MDQKPWKMNGPHRGGFGSDRRERDRFSDRREDRFSDRREDRFSDRRDDRRGDRRASDRFSDRRPGGDRARSGRPFAERRERFGVRSGPRARALENRRYAEKSDFEKNAVVRLAADVAPYFENAEAVNDALRHLIAAAGLLKTAAKKSEETAAAPAVTEEEAEKLFADQDREDDVEYASYGDAEAQDDAEQAPEEDVEEKKPEA